MIAQATEVANAGIHLQSEKELLVKTKANQCQHHCPVLQQAHLHGCSCTGGLRTEQNSILDTSRGSVSADQTWLNPEIHRGRVSLFLFVKIKDISSSTNAVSLHCLCNVALLEMKNKLLISKSFCRTGT